MTKSEQIRKMADKIMDICIEIGVDITIKEEKRVKLIHACMESVCILYKLSRKFKDIG